MFYSDETHSNMRVSQRGFSLIEVLIVLIISAMIMTLFAQVYLGAERSHQKLTEFVGENRSAFYTRQQLRARVADITYPDNFGRSVETALGVTAAFRREKETNAPALIGEAGRVSGVMWDRFASDQRRRKFTLEILPSGDRLRSRHIGQVRLTFDDEGDGVVLALSRDSIAAFQYVDSGGAIHTAWPPVSDQGRRQVLSARASNSLSDYLRSARVEAKQRQLPSALILRLEGPDGPSALIFEIAR